MTPIRYHKSQHNPSLPRDVLSNGENNFKSRLIELIHSVLVAKKESI